MKKLLILLSITTCFADSLQFIKGDIVELSYLGYNNKHLAKDWNKANEIMKNPRLKLSNCKNTGIVVDYFRKTSISRISYVVRHEGCMLMNTYYDNNLRLVK